MLPYIHIYPYPNLVCVCVDANGMPPIGNGTIPINSVVDINGSEVSHILKVYNIFPCNIALLGSEMS
jgi:hypothetical protein